MNYLRPNLSYVVLNPLYSGTDHISKNETRHFDVIMVLKSDTHDEIQFDVR